MPEQTPWARPDSGEPPDPAGGVPPSANEAPGEPGARHSDDAADLPMESSEAAAVAAAAAALPAARGAGGGGSGVIAILGVMVLVLSALIAGLVAYVTADGGTKYPLRLANEDYDLAAMALRERDLPSGMLLAGKIEFDNEEWALIIDDIDPEARVRQLDAQRRVRNHVSIFAWPDGGTFHLAKTLSLISQSTLYENEAAARDSVAGLCGLRLDERLPVDEFRVPRIGQDAVGFFVTSTDPQIGKSIETVVCFRTGRVVHGIVQNALDGAQDIRLVVNLARRMLVHVENTFRGRADPIDEGPSGG